MERVVAIADPVQNSWVSWRKAHSVIWSFLSTKRQKGYTGELDGKGSMEIRKKNFFITPYQRSKFQELKSLGDIVPRS